MRTPTLSPVWTFTARIRTLSRAVSTRRSKCGSVVKERRRRGRRVCIIYVCAFDSFVPASYCKTELKLRAVVSTLTDDKVENLLGSQEVIYIHHFKYTAYYVLNLMYLLRIIQHSI
uniref:Uncharacterized protein n=1 Tax=Cacopsylla melanoneura TaxID=428564 RepID=A0A8D9BRE5_9HEMI